MNTGGSNHPEIELLQARFKVTSVGFANCVILAFLNDHFSVYPLLPVAKMFRIILLK